MYKVLIDRFCQQWVTESHSTSQILLYISCVFSPFHWSIFVWRNELGWVKVINEARLICSLFSDITLDHNTLEDFLREGLIMRDFTHQNVLSLIGVAVADHGMPMIVLPFMSNGSLKSYVMKPKVQVSYSVTQTIIYIYI